MKKILFALLMVGMTSAHAAPRWNLILTVQAGHGSSIAIGGDYFYESTCKAAGEQWVKKVEEYSQNAFYICSRQA